MSAIETIRETIRRHQHHEPQPLAPHQVPCSFCGVPLGLPSWHTGFVNSAVPGVVACPGCLGQLEEMARQGQQIGAAA